MKRSFFYHPFCKGLFLALFAISLLSSAFFAGRLIFMVQNHVLDGPEAFAPPHAVFDSAETAFPHPDTEEYTVFYNACMRDYARVPQLALWCGVSLLACVLTFILLLAGAGMTQRSEQIKLSPIDRIPLELVAIAKGVMLAGTIMLGGMWFSAYDTKLFYYLYGYLTPEEGQSMWRAWLFIAAGAALLLLVGFLSLWSLMGLARRIRAKTHFDNTLVAICFRLIARPTKSFFSNLPLFLTWTLFFGVLLLLALFFGRVVAGICALVLYAGVCFVIWQLERVRKGTGALASGMFDHQIKTESMHGVPKQMAENLNCIGEGMSRAVEARLKSERFRTELITNVSHDIKTPLTSIINYTDLLTKEEPENERMREYIAILSRQSARLKKLTEDLLDASKASSGALHVSSAELDAAEMLRQVLGEYEERFAAASLIPVLSVPEDGALVVADGRHLWRVFDNLMSNILKYSMRGTRVHLTAEAREDGVYLTFKNISAEALNLDASELTERFVRGDTSRHTEGSGLGLAIAKSLTELLGGTLHVSVNADLFCVTVCFPHAHVAG